MSSANDFVDPSASGPEPSGGRAWSYREAFSRNLGLISPEEQEKLRASRVAIAGMGGVGGVHLMTLARLGIGRFTIADPDSFEVANFNRQYGATVSNLGRNKARTMAEYALEVNPELDLRVYEEKITPQNVGEFLDGADVLLDGIDFFSFDTRRLIFREARRRGIWALTAGPIGFSVAWLLFDPQGMDFDTYFDFHDGMAPLDQFAAFAIGLAPRGTHFSYLDLSHVEGRAARGPSAGLAASLCAGVAAVEAAKILLRRGPLRPAPCYAQFDAYRGILRQGRLWFANRGPLQRLKRSILRNRMHHLGYVGRRG